MRKGKNLKKETSRKKKKKDQTEFKTHHNSDYWIGFGDVDECCQ